MWVSRWNKVERSFGQRSCYQFESSSTNRENVGRIGQKKRKKVSYTRTYKINMDKIREKRDSWRWRRLTCVTFRHRFVRCQVKECQNLSLHTRALTSQQYVLLLCSVQRKFDFWNIIRVWFNLRVGNTKRFSRFHTWRVAADDDDDLLSRLLPWLLF